jgi:hypothetical protein
VPALPSCLTDPIWEQVQALIPDHEDCHPLGCHRPRIPDHVVFDLLINALVFGVGYRRIADLRPFWARVDPGTHTLYVALFFDGDVAGVVAVIDTTACRAADTSGCGSLVTTVTGVGRGLFDIAVDPSNHQVFTSSINHASVSQIDGRRCNASVISGCSAVDLDTDDQAQDLTLDPVSHTMYVLERLHPAVGLIDTRVRRG